MSNELTSNPVSLAPTPLSDARKKLVLHTLYETNSLPEAIEKSGLTLMDVMNAAEEDPEFAVALEKAEEHLTVLAEHEAKRRAIFGVEEPITSNGKVVYITDKNGIRKPLTRRVYSDGLLQFILKNRNQKVFGDKVTVNSNVKAVIVVPDVANTNIDDFLAEMDENKPFIDVEFRNITEPDEEFNFI